MDSISLLGVSISFGPYFFQALQWIFERRLRSRVGAVEFFKNNKIVQVILNKECIYPAGHLTSSSIANKLSASESIEEEPAELSGSEEEPGETQAQTRARVG